MSEQPDTQPTSARGSKGTSARKGPPASSEADLLREISAKLDRVVAVLAAQGKEKERQVEILAAAGCDSHFIGTVVGMTAGGVRMLQSRQRARLKRVPESEESGEAG